MLGQKSAVLIHGCHVGANLNGKDWNKIVLGGDNFSLEGRAIKGLFVAYEFVATKLIFGTGASQLNGVSEAHYTQNQLLKNLDPILLSHDLSIGHETRFQDLICNALVDDQSKNIREEVSNAISWCMDNGYERLILVSSSWHIPRCHLEALECAHKYQMEFGYATKIPEIIAIGSHGSTEKTVVSEPPHRGDRPNLPINLLIKQADSLGRKSEFAEGFCERLNQFLITEKERLASLQK